MHEKVHAGYALDLCVMGWRMKMRGNVTVARNEISTL